MGRELCDRFAEARRVFEIADEVLGFPLSRLCFEGPDDDLRMTENTQPAILMVSIAAFQVLKSRHLIPDFVAGHSLGEYSAAVAAGSLELEEALTTVRKRGRYMQEAVPVGTGAMAAIVGMNSDVLLRVCSESAQGQVVSPANYNSPHQIVIAGHREAVERARVLAKERGAKRAVPLSVSAPFHCALMMPAQERLQPDLRRLRFSKPRMGFVNNVDAALVTDPTALREGLIRQVSSPVMWRQAIEKLIGMGVDAFIEVGPGKVLTGLMRKTPGHVQAYHVEDPDSLEFVLAELD